ncbi:MAG: hypothetical protein EXR48_05760 [Dehalococcoidia bacterium]|nr:hypothetical protein [Dehalococcoidia bacterium]
MPVEQHLEEGEVVLASSGFFYATDRRILRYEPHPMTGPKAESLEYRQVQGIRAKVDSNFRLVVTSLLVLALGLVDPAGSGAIRYILLIAGVVSLTYAVLNRKAVWQIQSDELSSAARARWHIKDERNERTARLLKLVQSRVGQTRQQVGPSSSTPHPEPGLSQDRPPRR